MANIGRQATKVCIICGESCADRPRVKNPQGQYACRTCVEQRAGHYGIERDVSPPQPMKPCPACGRKMSADAAICATCGFNCERGIPAAVAMDGVAHGKDGPTCAGCGYSLRGLRSARCPECGTPFQPRPRQRLVDDSRHIVRMAYLTPLLMLMIGAGGVALYLLLADGAIAAGVYLFRYAVLVPLGVGAYFLCCLLWIGFDAPLHLTALRLAGIYAVVDLCMVLLDLTGLPYLITWLVGVCLYVGMLAQMLEIEVNDAIMVAILTGILKFVIGIIIVASLMG